MNKCDHTILRSAQNISQKALIYFVNRNCNFKKSSSCHSKSNSNFLWSITFQFKFTLCGNWGSESLNSEFCIINQQQMSMVTNYKSEDKNDFKWQQFSELLMRPSNRWGNSSGELVWDMIHFCFLCKYEISR